MDDEYGDEPEYGIGSQLWMMKMSLAHVPHELLYHGVSEMIDFLVNNGEDETDIETILDVLVQNSLTGFYIDPTMLGEETEVPRTRVRLTEDDIEDQVNLFRKILGRTDNEEEK